MTIPLLDDILERMPLSLMNIRISTVTAFAITLLLLCATFAAAQERADAAPNTAAQQKPSLQAGAFSATKYAKLYRVLPNGKLHFIRSERHPVRIARDTEGRIMMQYLDDDELTSECDRPTMRIPPPCPAWDVFVIDPVSQHVTHWSEGEFAAHVALEMPLSPQTFESATRLTSDVPSLQSDLDTDAINVRNEDLGERTISGIRARGRRTTFIYPAGHAGNKIPISRIHEVWISPEMNLIVRVIDGDPNGLEHIWGLEKLPCSPTHPSSCLQPDIRCSIRKPTGLLTLISEPSNHGSRNRK